MQSDVQIRTKVVDLFDRLHGLNRGAFFFMAFMAFMAAFFFITFMAFMAAFFFITFMAFMAAFFFITFMAFIAAIFFITFMAFIAFAIVMWRVRSGSNGERLRCPCQNDLSPH